MASWVKGNGDLAYSKVDFKRYHLCFPSNYQFWFGNPRIACSSPFSVHKCMWEF